MFSTWLTVPLTVVIASLPIAPWTTDARLKTQTAIMNTKPTIKAMVLDLSQDETGEAACNVSVFLNLFARIRIRLPYPWIFATLLYLRPRRGGQRVA